MPAPSGSAASTLMSALQQFATKTALRDVHVPLRTNADPAGKPTEEEVEEEAEEEEEEEEEVEAEVEAEEEDCLDSPRYTPSARL